MHTACGVAIELGQDPHRRVKQSQATGGPGDRGELIGDTEARDDAEDLVIEVHRARLRIDARPSVQYQAVDTVLRQQRRGGDTGRARTDDDDGHFGIVFEGMIFPDGASRRRVYGRRGHAYLTGGALGAEVDGAVVRRDVEFHDVAVLQVLRVLGLPFEERLPFDGRRQ